MLIGPLLFIKMKVSGSLGSWGTGGDNKLAVNVVKEGEGQMRSEYAITVEVGGLEDVEVIGALGRGKNMVGFLERG